MYRYFNVKKIWKVKFTDILKGKKVYYIKLNIIPGMVLSKINPINPPINIPEDMNTKAMSLIHSNFVLMKRLCVVTYLGSACEKKIISLKNNYQLPVG